VILENVRYLIGIRRFYLDSRIYRNFFVRQIPEKNLDLQPE